MSMLPAASEALGLRPTRIASGMLLAALGLAFVTGSAAPALRASEVEELRDLPYHVGPDADPAQRLDLYLPAGESRAPLLVWFPGGDWRRVDRAAYAEAGRALAARGMGLAVAGYRSLPARHPAQAEDAARALSFARNRLILSGREPDDLFLAGQDSGAHLAALVALNPRFLAVHGLAPEDLRGTIGLSGTYRVDPSDVDRSDLFGLDPRLRLDASPLHHATSDAPPIQLLYGAYDLPGRAEEAQGLARQLRALGAEAETVELAARSFNSLWRDLGEAGDATTEAILAFVARHRLGVPTPRPTDRATPGPSATPRPGPAAAPGPPESGPGSATGLLFDAWRLERLERGNLAWWQGTPEGDLLGLPGRTTVLRLLVFVPPPGPADPSEPDAYRRWLEHLTRAGNVVIVPDYAAPGLASADWSLRVQRVVRVASESLEADGTAIDAEGMAWVGHGEGAVLALNGAAGWFEAGLPAPRAILAALPRDPLGLLDVAGLRRLPADLRLLIVAAASDAGRDAALERVLHERALRGPIDWRDRVLVPDDAHGAPVLRADFQLPYTDGPFGRLDTHDWRGSWKWLDALLACAYEARLCEHALGGGPQQLDLGRWSDGRPVAVARHLPPQRAKGHELWLPQLLRRPIAPR